MSVHVVTDTKGRKISVSEMGPEDMLDLYEAIGPAAINPGFVNLAFIVWSVTEIDGVPSMPSSKKEHIRARAKALGNEGMLAVQRFLFGSPDEALPEVPAAPAEIEHAPCAVN